MSSSRRSPPRLSDSPGRSIGESLLGKPFDQRAGHLGRPLELKPVSSPLQNLELVLAGDVLGRLFGLASAERGILVSPQQRCRRFHVGIHAQARPWMVAGKVGAVVVETGGEPPGSRQRANEMVDGHGRYRRTQHAAQAPVLVLAEDLLGL